MRKYLLRLMGGQEHIAVAAQDVILFFQQKIEWIWLYEQHPDLYKKAMEFEKDGYTWNQGESLADLIKPERIRKIKLDIIKRQEENRAKQKGTTLVDLFGDDIMCSNCFI